MQTRTRHPTSLSLTLLVAIGMLSGCATQDRPCVGLALPAYFDPDDFRTWQQLGAAGPKVSIAVLNPDSGPGARRDPRFSARAAALRGRGIRVLGYVSTGYGKRTSRAVLADIERYVNWFDISDVFLDETASDEALLPLYRSYVEAVRSRRGFVALNPGTVPDQGFAPLADVLVTFEGSAKQYRHIPPPPEWLIALPRDRVWHLVHSTDPHETGAMLDLARSRGAGRVYITDGLLPQPWDRLPEAWSRQLAESQPEC